MDLESIGTRQKLPARTTLLHEGFAADKVVVLCSGRVKLCASSADGRLLLLRVAGPGDVLGLASVLRGTRYKVTAETLEACVVKAIPKAQFVRFMASNTDVSQSTSLTMAREFESALLSARRLALSTSAAGKLASALLDWARLEHHNDDTGAPLSFQMPLTHEELGSLAGISRETVTRLLSRFRKEGLITMTGEFMVLQKPRKLEALYC